jgi:hypothetical protein
VPLRSPGQDTIDWLIAEDAGQLPLGPLSDTAVAALCAHVLEAHPDATVLALAARSGGAVHLAGAVVSRAARRGAGAHQRRHRDDGGRRTALSFLAAVDRRMRALSPDARRLLEVGSVLNRPFTVHAAADLMAGRRPNSSRRRTRPWKAAHWSIAAPSSRSGMT